jgi:hypothetical protein
MSNEKKEIELTCGVVMPISAIDGCDENHWNDVLDIISDAVCDAGFEANLVSNADEVGVIHKRIVQNLYENPIVVCDISGKNPNVMFELGLRLAFDKPTIIVKDDKTPYSFDTSAIEHIEYPRDLRFNRIQDFKSKLAEKIKHTYAKYLSDPDNFSTFLKHFGEFKVAKIKSTEVSKEEFLLDELQNIKSLILGRNYRNQRSSYTNRDIDEVHIDICCGPTSVENIDKIIKKYISESKDVIGYEIEERGSNHRHVEVEIVPGSDRIKLRGELRSLLRNREISKKTEPASRVKKQPTTRAKKS